MSTKNLKEYYSDICQLVIEKIQVEAYEEALDILNEELSQPYIPIEFFHNLNTIKLDIEQQLLEKNYHNEITNLTKMQIWDRIYNPELHQFNNVFFNVLLNKYNDELDEIDLAIINKILLDKKIDNVEKSIILEQLKSLAINHQFNIYNNYLKNQFQTNPFEESELDLQLKVMFKELENHFLQDPSRLEIAISLLQVLATKYLPIPIKFDKNDIINSVINITNSLFDDDELIKNEITEILQEYIK